MTVTCFPGDVWPVLAKPGHMVEEEPFPKHPFPAYLGTWAVPAFGAVSLLILPNHLPSMQTKVMRLFSFLRGPSAEIAASLFGVSSTSSAGVRIISITLPFLLSSKLWAVTLKWIYDCLSPSCAHPLIYQYSWTLAFPIILLLFLLELLHCSYSTVLHLFQNSSS